MKFYESPGWMQPKRPVFSAFLLSILAHGMIFWFLSSGMSALLTQEGAGGQQPKFARLSINLLNHNPNPVTFQAQSTPVAESIQKPAIAKQPTVNSKPQEQVIEKLYETSLKPLGKTAKIPLKPAKLLVVAKPVIAKKLPNNKPLVKPTTSKVKISKPAPAQFKATTVSKKPITLNTSLAGKNIVASRGAGGVVGVDNKKQLGLLRISISHLLANHFSYPVLAQRRNWQGTVVLEVSIEPSGHFSQVRVVESSGHRVLDLAATKTVNSLGRLPANRKGHLLQTVRVRLPIIYKLDG